MARLNTPPPASARLPGFEWVPNDHNTGGTYTVQAWRVVLHTTEFPTSSLAHAWAVAAAHPNPPHVWFGWAPGNVEVAIQTVRLDRSARALRQPSSGPSTNRYGALQCEIFTTAATAGAEFSDARLRRIAERVVVPLAQWAAARGGTIVLETRPRPGPGLAEGRFGTGAADRMSSSEWIAAAARRILCHYDVWGNSHWDTGTLNTPRIAEHARQIMNGDQDVPLTNTEIEAIAHRANEVRVAWENQATQLAAAGGPAPSASLASNRVWAKGYHVASREAAEAATAAVNARADEILAAVAALAADVANGVTVTNEVTVTTLPPEVLDQIRAVLVTMLAGGIAGLNPGE
ncbi:MAG: hypothetical protein S0880_10315 [Actinomycetota bacterium]|nr:hypothetical protein [Actinomycetota bacterium]